MAQSDRLSPMHPSPARYYLDSMAQTRRHTGLLLPDPFQRREQRSTGLQLPPIHTTSRDPPAYNDNKRSVQLPPLQIPSNRSESSPTTTARQSIPVAQLLIDSPATPWRAEPSIRAERPMDMRSTQESVSTSPIQYRCQPIPYSPAPPYEFEVGSMPFRHTSMMPVYPSEYSCRTHYDILPPAPVYPSQTPHGFSPVDSTYPTPSSTYSEASPRSSVGSQSYSWSVESKPRPSAPPPLPPPPPLHFNLSIRQQPAAARACGFGERDRRVIDPPPILELKITNRATGLPTSDPAGMLALNCSLLSADGREDETELPAASPDMRSTQRLMGTLVASPYQAKDEHGVAGTFFVFPDLSCRSPGKYRLRFKLLRVEPTNMASGGRSVASMVTDVFSVYTAKDFPGMRASSALLKALRKQGLNVGVKKGSEASKAKGKSKGKSKKEESSESDEDEDDEDDKAEDDSDHGGSSVASPKTSKKKQGKRRKRSE